jgi:phospholipid/cholesterol/gamma-HCH transport system substrate-binding protein
MSSKVQKIKAGMFVAITGGLLAVVLIVFGGMRFWEKRHHFTILCEDTVYGLEPGAHVFLNGIKVGRVDGVQLLPTDLSKVEVSISVKDDAPIHTDTVAMLAYAGITGLKVIDLRGASATTPLLPEGGVIKTGKSGLDKIQEKAQEIADQSTQLMERAKAILDNLAALSDPAKFQPIVDKSRAMVDNLASASADLKGLIAENRIALRETIGAAKGAVTSTQAIIDSQVTGLVGSARELMGDLATLVHGSEGPIRSALFDLRQASRNFKELSRDVRQKPSRLLFSSAPGERKLP